MKKNTEVLNEMVKLIELKRKRKEKITYEELDFVYNGIVYSIIHNPPKVFIGINVVYNEGKYVTEKFEEYLDIEDLLKNFRIHAKKIKEIWNDVAFG